MVSHSPGCRRPTWSASSRTGCSDPLQPNRVRQVLDYHGLAGHPAGTRDRGRGPAPGDRRDRVQPGPNRPGGGSQAPADHRADHRRHPPIGTCRRPPWPGQDRRHPRPAPSRAAGTSNPTRPPRPAICFVGRPEGHLGGRPDPRRGRPARPGHAPDGSGSVPPVPGPDTTYWQRISPPPSPPWGPWQDPTVAGRRHPGWLPRTGTG